MWYDEEVLNTRGLASFRVWGLGDGRCSLYHSQRLQEGSAEVEEVQLAARLEGHLQQVLVRAGDLKNLEREEGRAGKCRKSWRQIL